MARTQNPKLRVWRQVQEHQKDNLPSQWSLGSVKDSVLENNVES